MTKTETELMFQEDIDRAVDFARSKAGDVYVLGLEMVSEREEIIDLCKLTYWLLTRRNLEQDKSQKHIHDAVVRICDEQYPCKIVLEPSTRNDIIENTWVRYMYEQAIMTLATRLTEERHAKYDFVDLIVWLLLTSDTRSKPLREVDYDGSRPK